jgi:hypothetical protein
MAWFRSSIREQRGPRFGYLDRVGEKIARLSPFPHHTRFL